MALDGTMPVGHTVPRGTDRHRVPRFWVVMGRFLFCMNRVSDDACRALSSMAITHTPAGPNVGSVGTSFHECAPACTPSIPWSWSKISSPTFFGPGGSTGHVGGGDTIVDTINSFIPPARTMTKHLFAMKLTAFPCTFSVVLVLWCVAVHPITWRMHTIRRTHVQPSRPTSPSMVATDSSPASSLLTDSIMGPNKKFRWWRNSAKIWFVSDVMSEPSWLPVIWWLDIAHDVTEPLLSTWNGVDRVLLKSSSLHCRFSADGTKNRWQAVLGPKIFSTNHLLGVSGTSLASSDHDQRGRITFWYHNNRFQTFIVGHLHAGTVPKNAYWWLRRATYHSMMESTFSTPTCVGPVTSAVPCYGTNRIVSNVNIHVVTHLHVTFACTSIFGGRLAHGGIFSTFTFGHRR